MSKLRFRKIKIVYRRRKRSNEIRHFVDMKINELDFVQSLMRIHSMKKMFCSLILFVWILINEIHGDCLYPQWKNTCQKYCMSNQLYEIQLNQCYSQDPNQLTCKCSGQILTEKILNLIQMNNSKTISSTTINPASTCVPSQSCLIGKSICYGSDSYCLCENGIWVNHQCSSGKTCERENPSVSCQTLTSSIDQGVSLFSSSNVVCSSLIMIVCFQNFLREILIKTA